MMVVTGRCCLKQKRVAQQAWQYFLVFGNPSMIALGSPVFMSSVMASTSSARNRQNSGLSKFFAGTAEP
jgi:hypothetical protein